MATPGRLGGRAGSCVRLSHCTGVGGGQAQACSQARLHVAAAKAGQLRPSTAARRMQQVRRPPAVAVQHAHLWQMSQRLGPEPLARLRSPHPQSCQGEKTCTQCAAIDACAVGWGAGVAAHAARSTSVYAARSTGVINTIRGRPGRGQRQRMPAPQKPASQLLHARRSPVDGGLPCRLFGGRGRQVAAELDYLCSSGWYSGMRGWVAGMHATRHGMHLDST